MRNLTVCGMYIQLLCCVMLSVTGLPTYYNGEATAGCGVKLVPSFDIIGGEDALPGSWPWQVSFNFSPPGSGIYVHVCGGSLISETAVVTAAHCFDASLGEGRDDAANYKVLLGGHSQSEPTGYEQVVDVIQLAIHPDWNANPLLGLPNDIAVAFLLDAANTGMPHIGTVCLPDSQEQSFIDEQCWISGWGLTEDGGSEAPDILQEAPGHVITNVGCQANIVFPIRPTHICVGGDNSSRTCNGDSGGPLSCEVGGSWVLGGVSSWTIGGCAHTPSVLTRVSHYLEWIHAVLHDTITA